MSELRDDLAATLRVAIKTTPWTPESLAQQVLVVLLAGDWFDEAVERMVAADLELADAPIGFDHREWAAIVLRAALGEGTE